MTERVDVDEALSPAQLKDLDEQVAKQVCDLSLSALMTSGAGCGKTYQMVQRYVAIIRAGVPVTQIIAVTFTEKAAAELRDRVRQRCRELAADTRLAAEERAHWEGSARQLAMAPVSTIHGLCSRLLRENAIAAGVDPHFVQLDETQQGLMLGGAVRETLLARLHKREESAERVLARWDLGEACEILAGLVKDRERLSELLDAPPGADELLARWQAAAEAARVELLTEALTDEAFRDSLDALHAVDAPPDGDKATERRATVLEHAAVAADESLDAPRRIEALLSLFGAVNRTKVGAQGNWKGRTDELDAMRAAFCVLADLKDDFGKPLQALDAVEDRPTAELAAALAAEAAAACRAYSEAKRARSALDFADLQLLARNLLRDHPGVLARIQRRYEHILVDEFQDTNDLQRDIIWLIAGADPETGAPAPGGRLFVVGDAKQSIYGFRNADVTVFNATCEDFRACEQTARIISLPATRRSHPGLVRLFNDLFSDPTVMGTERARVFEARYEPVRAARDEHPLELDAELLLVRSDQVDDEGEAGVRETRIAEAEHLARRIRELHESEACVSDTDDEGQPITRPVRWGDFGMLFRAMTNVGIYEHALRNEGIPFYTVAGRGFYNRQEVRDCLALLRVLENTSDEIALAGALRSPMFGVSDDAIFWLTRGTGTLITSLADAAGGRHPMQAHIDDEQLGRLDRAWDVISRLREIRNRATLSELTERLIAETGLAAVHLTQFGGRQAAANLAKLTDLARAFEETGEFSLRAFIAYLGDLFLTEHREGLADVHEESANVVKLMTVHKAKGLEWPVVVVPDLGRRGRGSTDPILADPLLGPIAKIEDEEGRQSWGAMGALLRQRDSERDEAEDRRLLYVALTRARDLLLLSSPMAVTTKGKLSAGNWLQWLFAALGLDVDTLEDETLVGGERWSCRVRALGRSEEPAYGAGSAVRGRAAPSLIEEALGIARSTPRPLPERVLPLDAATLTPDRLSVTALQGYMRCPRRFLLRHVRGLSERPGEGDWLHGLSAVRLGDVAHRALEIIGRGGAGAIEGALRQMRLPGGGASGATDEQLERVERGVRWLVEEEPLYEQWIAGAARLRAEVPFVAPLAGTLVEGTIDALAEDSGGGWRIIDYKTGTQGAEKLGGYRFQVGLYCAAVRAVTGTLPVAAAIVLLDQREVVQLVPAAEADGALAAAVSVIEGILAGEFPRAVTCEGPGCPLAYACELA